MSYLINSLFKQYKKSLIGAHTIKVMKPENIVTTINKSKVTILYVDSRIARSKLIGISKRPIQNTESSSKQKYNMNVLNFFTTRNTKQVKAKKII